MRLFPTQENRIRCGSCNTEFDLNKNKEGCPLCGFGKTPSKIEFRESTHANKTTPDVRTHIQIPPALNLMTGTPVVDEETQIWGSWLMFNDFFAPKFLSRVLAWKMHNENVNSILLSDLMENSITLIRQHDLSRLKGFPNLEKDREGNRLVHHFLKSFVNMGLIRAQASTAKGSDVWKENWNKIQVSLTKEGLEFARLNNQIFDQGKSEQVLTPEEKVWLVNYLRQIDKKGHREYSVLKEVHAFLKAGNNGNSDLWSWFENNRAFQDYVRKRSKRAENQKMYQKQLFNYARSFSSAKISLLREIGVVKDKRNDYTVLGEL